MGVIEQKITVHHNRMGLLKLDHSTLRQCSRPEQIEGANEEKKKHTLDKRHEDGVVASQSVRPAFCGRPKWLRVNPLGDFLLHHSVKIQQLLISH